MRRRPPRSTRTDTLLPYTTLVRAITHIRLTGGEPLLRRGLRECVATLDALRPLGLQRISMTSNASLLAPLAAQLKAAGLDDLNISLDSVDPATFLHMTGRELRSEERRGGKEGGRTCRSRMSAYP